MLMMSLSPILTALFGWVFLDESLPLLAWAGILMTVGGVAWVVMERDGSG